MNYNQILSFFPIVYPNRINSKTQSDSIKRSKFRKLCNKFKLNEQNRLIILNPNKANNTSSNNVWYNIPYESEKQNILNQHHWNNNHCGRDAMVDLIKRNNWYWFGFYKDIMNYINNCPFCDNIKSKFKKINTGFKIITDKGPHYRYIADLWYLSKEIRNKSGFNYILDVIDHFSKWYQGYALVTKSSKEVLTYINSFVQSFGKPYILQTDNGLEFCNSDIENFCINNDIKIIHGKPRHPQSQGACEVCHREIKKYIYSKFIKEDDDFNLNKSLVEITNIHNNKKHSITEEIPKNIKDLNNKTDIEIIHDRIIKNLGRKNKNKDIIDFNKYYCIKSNLKIKKNKLEKGKNLPKRNLENIPIMIISFI